MAEESNPQPFGVITVFKTACRPRSETIRLAERRGIEPRTQIRASSVSNRALDHPRNAFQRVQRLVIFGFGFVAAPMRVRPAI